MTPEELEELADLGVDIESITPESIFRVHLMNIGAGILMVLIGVFLLLRTKKKRGGKRTAGWILLAIGISVIGVHVMQMIFS
ncbi:MAG: hypothetical protein ACRC3H_19860 [Lachnospiraceae bacterium]